MPRSYVTLLALCFIATACGDAQNGGSMAGSGAGAGAGTGAAGTTNAGTGAAGTGTAGTGAAGMTHAGTGAAGAAGVSGNAGGEPLDCTTQGEGCIELCEGGACQCDCSAAFECPDAAPTAGEACETSSKVCFYLADNHCRSLWQCHGDAWVELASQCYSHEEALCPSTSTEYLSGTCSSQVCLYEGGSVCSCKTPSCSGIPQPAQPTCEPVVPAGCKTTPTEGGACAPVGLQCGTTCCGVGWECTAAGWHATDYPCPP